MTNLLLKIKSHSSVLDDPEDRKDGILEVGGEEISADEADPDYTEYMTGGVSEAEKCFFVCFFFFSKIRAQA